MQNTIHLHSNEFKFNFFARQCCQTELRGFHSYISWRRPLEETYEKVYRLPKQSRRHWANIWKLTYKLESRCVYMDTASFPTNSKVTSIAYISIRYDKSCAIQRDGAVTYCTLVCKWNKKAPSLSRLRFLTPTFFSFLFRPGVSVRIANE